MLTVEYSEEVVLVLKKKTDDNHICKTIRKRCRALLAKMENPRMGSHTIARITGTSRNFVDKVIHTYNASGLQDVLFTEEKGGRPNRLAGQWIAVSEALREGVPRSAKEAVGIIQKESGLTFSLTWARALMKDSGMAFKKLQPIPVRADPDKQKQWIADIQQLSMKQAKANVGSCLWTQSILLLKPSPVKSGAGRNFPSHWSRKKQIQPARSHRFLLPWTHIVSFHDICGCRAGKRLS